MTFTKSKLESTKTILTRGLQRPEFTVVHILLQIQQNWANLVGPLIAAATKIVSLRRGVLTIQAKSSPWQNELTYLTPMLLHRLQEHFDAQYVQSIRIKAGSFVNFDSMKTTVTNQPIAQAAWHKAKTMSQPIADDQVRQAFESLLARHFSRQKPKKNTTHR